MLSVIDAAYYGAIAYGSSLLLKYLYRLSPLHPLYRVPGPRAAALSTLCEFYYNIVQDGQFVYVVTLLSLSSFESRAVR